MKLSKALVATLLLVLVLSVVGCSGGGSNTANPPSSGTTTVDTPAAGATVIEKGFAFEPATLEVKVGDTVTFKNEDSAPHNVSIDGKELGSQDPGASVTWTAEKAGTFPYTCTIHPSMNGTIVVK
jgi:plastocyanin